MTGTPGVGKTSVAKALAAKLGALYLSVADIVRDEGLISGFDVKRKSPVGDVKRVSKRVKETVRSSKKDIIIEGHYASYVTPSSLVSYVFVLRRDPDALKAEFEARGYEEAKADENVASEILDVCLVDAIEKYGVEMVDEIDTTQRSVSDVVEEALMVLEGRRKPRVGVVDWLSKLDGDGRLDRILSQLSRA